jgi:uncharacterized membrane protein YecN with MAPEG domain
MNLPLYTAALGAAILLLQTVLMMAVGLNRIKGPVIGLDGTKDFERKVRRHANLAESSGLVIAVLAVLEIIAGQTWYVAALCTLYLVARLTHALAFSSLAGSHAENVTGARKLFALGRVAGAFGTLMTGFGTAAAIGFNLI